MICELVGIPYEDRKKIFEWSNNMIGGDDPDLSPGDDAATNASAQMWLYCNALAEEKRKNPDDTLISKYVHGSVDGEKITEQELNHFFVHPRDHSNAGEVHTGGVNRALSGCIELKHV